MKKYKYAYYMHEKIKKINSFDHFAHQSQQIRVVGKHYQTGTLISVTH